MSKKYNKAGITRLLTDLSSAMAAQTADFPALIPVVLAMTVAAKDPTITPESAKVAPKAAKPKKAKPVSLSYEGESLIVRGTPWGQVGLAVKQAFNKIVGRASKQTDAAGGVIYLTCWDKKAKGFRLPADKVAEVMVVLKDKGLPVQAAA